MSFLICSKRAESREVGDRVGEDLAPGKGYARGQAGHVLLCYPGIDELTGDGLDERFDDTETQVAGDEDDVWVGLGCREQIRKESSSHPPTSESASSSSSGEGGR